MCILMVNKKGYSMAEKRIFPGALNEKKVSVNMKDIFLSVGIFIILNMSFGEFYRLICGDIKYGTYNYKDVSLGDAIRETYDPYFHAARYEVVYRWLAKGESYRSDKINSRFKTHACVLGIEAFILACLLIGYRKRHKDKNGILKIEKHNLDQKFVAMMMKFVPDIVKNMSKESSVYFEMLMDGTLDYEQNPVIFEIAKSILDSHLQSHPEDMKRVLSVFDEKSLPQDILAKYKQNTVGR